MPRRGNNIYKRKDGRWEGRLKRESSLGEGRKYISFYGKTYHEVREKMAVMQSSITDRKCCTLNIEEILSIWLNDQKLRWKETTYATYRQMADKQIIPKLGKLKGKQITNRTIEDFVIEKRTGEGGKRLSDSYIHNICSILFQALQYVQKKYNFDLKIPSYMPPKGKKGRMLLPRPQKLAVLEKYLIEHKEDTTCMGILLAMHTGIRIGELCALTWEDIDLEENILYVRKNMQRVKHYDGQKNNTEVHFQTPKTVNSVREIPISPELTALMKSCSRNKNKFFVQGKKNPWAEPRTVQYRFARILKKCRIEAFNFHKLRHCFATRCIEMGFDIKSLSEILGHSNIQITLNLYVHTTMEQKKKLMNLIGLYFPIEEQAAV